MSRPASGVRRATRRRRLRQWAALLLSAAFFTLGAAAWQPSWLADGLTLAYPDVLWRVDTPAAMVALTFDDGPAPDHTPAFLEVLARHEARATFFLIGDRAARFPKLVERIRAGGHEIGNHHYGLRSNLRMTDAEFEKGLLRTDAVLGLAGPYKLYRPPGGFMRQSQRELLRRHGYRCVLGSAYPFDGNHTTTWYIRWLVAKNLSPGTIVILHDGIADPSRTLAALDGILVAGTRKGLRFVPVGELLDSGGQDDD